MTNFKQAINVLKQEVNRLDLKLLERDTYGDLRIQEGDTKDNIVDHLNSYKSAITLLNSKAEVEHEINGR